jgi:Zn-dependent peptidase ImmA (M78 family)
MLLDNKVQKKLDSIITHDCYKGYELQLDSVCTKLGLSLFSATFTDTNLSGAIYKDNDQFKIYVNKNHPITRKRFTIAHEIGHYISALSGSHSAKQLFSDNQCFEDYNISYRKNGLFSEAETEANEIAAQILMPEIDVKHFTEQKLSIEEMAERFFVSQAAMSIRLYSLGVLFL